MQPNRVIVNIFLLVSLGFFFSCHNKSSVELAQSASSSKKKDPYTELATTPERFEYWLYLIQDNQLTPAYRISFSLQRELRSLTSEDQISACKGLLTSFLQNISFTSRLRLDDHRNQQVSDDLRRTVLKMADDFGIPEIKRRGLLLEKGIYRYAFNTSLVEGDLLLKIPISPHFVWQAQGRFFMEYSADTNRLKRAIEAKLEPRDEGRVETGDFVLRLNAIGELLIAFVDPLAVENGDRRQSAERRRKNLARAREIARSVTAEIFKNLGCSDEVCTFNARNQIEFRPAKNVTESHKKIVQLFESVGLDPNVVL